jgi:3-dehydroquinate synthase
VLVIGGGAVLDAVGFAAATAHRGVRLIRFPTTTLAQADGGLGVKNGINVFGKKNFLGTFCTPWAVINDARFLTTLSDRDHRCGFSEAVKVALIKDASLFADLCADATSLAAREEEPTRRTVRRAADLHLRHIVEGGDPFELTVSRPLDYGHWSAHKLEQITRFELRHGEAVAIGVALDTLCSVGRGWLAPSSAGRVLSCLADLGFELDHEALSDTSSLLGGLEEFREHLGGRLTITLLREIGQPVDVHDMDATGVEAAVVDLRAWWSKRRERDRAEDAA